MKSLKQLLVETKYNIGDTVLIRAGNSPNPVEAEILTSHDNKLKVKTKNGSIVTVDAKTIIKESKFDLFNKLADIQTSINMIVRFHDSGKLDKMKSEVITLEKLVKELKNNV